MSGLKSQRGYAVITDPDAGIQEFHTVTCCHCGYACLIKAGCDPSELGGMCLLCYRYVCAKCNAIGTCDPLEKKIERMEARDRFRRSLG